MEGGNDKDVERRIGLLEEKDRYNDTRFRKIEEKTRQNKQEVDNTIKEIFGSLREIEKGQHTQELTNQKMDFTLDSINRERELEKVNKEESSKNLRQIKIIVITAAIGFGFSFIMALIQQFLF
ncbi:DUF2951 family protein [Staphylococcus succinus]|uniref:DUF2951 family protein n=1 Tax=Staphylococcus succinus TaxID=61015 RepID=UPI00301D8F05